MPTEDEQRMLDRIKQDYDWAKSDRSTVEDDWKNWRMQYESKWSELEKEQDDENLKQWIFVPKTYSQLSRVEDTLLDHFFPEGREKLFKISPPTIDYTKGMAARILDEVLHAKLDIEASPVAQCQFAWNTAAVEGQGVLKPGWEIDQAAGISQPTLKWIPTENVLWDPYATCDDDIKFVIYRLFLSEDELLERERLGIFQNVQEVINLQRDEARQDEWRADKSGPNNRVRNLYEIWEFWGPQKMYADQTVEGTHRWGQHMLAQDIVATCYKNQVLLRMEPNDYATFFKKPTPREKLPFALLKLIYKRGSTYGYSLADLMRSLQREVNIVRNNRRQVTDMELGSKVVIDETRIVDRKSLKAAKYGGIVGVQGNTQGAIDWFVPKTSTAQLANEEAVMDDDIRQITGVTHVHQGEVPVRGGDTATGMSIMTSEGNVKQSAMVANARRSAFLPLGRFFAAAALRYVTPDEVSRIVGSDMRPEEAGAILQALGEEYHVEVEAGATATSKEIELRRLQAANQSLGQIINAAPEIVMPAMMRTTARILQQLNQGDIAGYMAEAQGGGGMMPPAGQNIGAPAGYESEMAMAQQGRSPTSEEMPRPIRGGPGGIPRRG